MKMIYLLIAFLVAWGTYQKIRGDYAVKRNAALVSENKELKRQEENRYKIEEVKKKIAYAVRDDKSGFDWHFNISDSLPLRRLRNSCHSCGKNKLH